MKTNRNIVFTLAVCLFSACPGSVLGADQPASRGRFGPQVVSPEVLADRTVTFRILAPNASDVRVSGNDMPEIGQGVEMTKGDEGVWSVTLEPVINFLGEKDVQSIYNWALRLGCRRSPDPIRVM
jgi:1,4-alpha-glucan branching enzyme